MISKNVACCDLSDCASRGISAASARPYDETAALIRRLAKEGERPPHERERRNCNAAGRPVSPAENAAAIRSRMQRIKEDIRAQNQRSNAFATASNATGKPSCFGKRAWPAFP